MNDRTGRKLGLFCQSVDRDVIHQHQAISADSAATDSRLAVYHAMQERK